MIISEFVEAFDFFADFAADIVNSTAESSHVEDAHSQTVSEKKTTTHSELSVRTSITDFCQSKDFSGAICLILKLINKHEGNDEGRIETGARLLVKIYEEGVSLATIENLLILVLIVHEYRNLTNSSNELDAKTKQPEPIQSQIFQQSQAEYQMNSTIPEISSMLTSSSVLDTVKYNIIQFIDIMFHDTLSDKKLLDEKNTQMKLEVLLNDTDESNENIFSGSDASAYLWTRIRQSCKKSQNKGANPGTITTVPPIECSIDKLQYTKVPSTDEQKKNQEEGKEFPPNVEVGEFATEKIHEGAKWIENSLSTIVVPNVNNGLDTVGNFAKRNLEPKIEETDADVTRRDEIVARTYSEASKRSTDVVRRAARSAAFGIRDASTTGINKIVEEWEENRMGERLMPEEEMREVTKTVGKIGVATLGAAQIVAESIFETTKSISQKSVTVTADIARHKFGNGVGTAVQNTGDATGNVLRAITHIAALEGKALTESVTRNTAKVQLEQQVQKRDHRISSEINGDNIEYQSQLRKNGKGDDALSSSVSSTAETHCNKKE